MVEKLELYDTMTSLLHGILFIAVAQYFFPELRGLADCSFPESLQTFIIVGFGYFVGQSITTLSSLVEDFYYRTWRGKPSDRALEGKAPEKYIDKETAKRVYERLQKDFGPNLSNEAVFRKALTMARVVQEKAPMVERQNRMYAYCRVSLTHLLLIPMVALASCLCRLSCCVNWLPQVAAGLFLILLILLHWFRAKQCGYYFVREVLNIVDLKMKGDK